MTRRFFFTLIASLISAAPGILPAAADVDMKAANFTDGFTDIDLGTSGILKVQRTYNSRSNFNGIFGYGWCSEYETKLEVTAEESFMITECGGGEEILYYRPNTDIAKIIQHVIDTIITNVKARHPELGKEYLDNLQEELVSDRFMRQEFARRLPIVGFPIAGETYRSHDVLETVVFDGRQFTRNGKDGVVEIFDVNGRLKERDYLNGNRLKMEYDGDLLIQVIKEDGSFLKFTYGENHKVSTAKNSTGNTVTYVNANDNLMKETVQKDPSVSYEYDYDAEHNLTLIKFADGTTKE